MRIEVTVFYIYGSLTFTVEALFHGEGTVEEGITAMLEETYPNALSISFYKISD